MNSDGGSNKMSAEVRFLLAVRDGDDLLPLVKEIGYGWAINEGLIRNIAPLPAMDFLLTDKGQDALRAFTSSKAKA